MSSDTYYLRALLHAIIAVLLVEAWGVLKIWAIIRKQTLE